MNVSNGSLKLYLRIYYLLTPKHPKIDFNTTMLLKRQCPGVVQALYSIHVLVTPYNSNNKEGIWK